MPKVCIRKAGPDDLSALMLFADTYCPRPRFARKAIRASVRAGEMLVATQRGAYAGGIAGFIRYHQRLDGWCTVYEVCVDRDERGRGIGRALLRRLAKPLQLKCPVESKANRFFRAFGFRRVGVEQGQYHARNIMVLR